MSQPASPMTSRKNLVCRVLMLDDTEEIFYIPNKSLGGVLFTKVVQKLQLLEADYFDLQYRNVEGILCWLDHEKPVTSHMPQNSLNFEFVVKFYTPDPGMLEEELTRYLFALQVKRDLATGQMPCQEQTAALLASYIIQAEFGDLTDEGYENAPDYLKSFKLFPNISNEVEARIIQHHREHFGQTPMDADYNLLDTARKVEFYGICMHDAKDHEGVALHLAVTHMGVVVFQNMTRINTFSWAKIRKLSFKRKKFLIKLHPEGYGFYKDTVEFYFTSRNECKNFWKKCLEHHAFFRCQSVKKIPRNKTRVVSHGSSFRYSGKTQKQLVDFVRENFSKRPSSFLRSTSMRTVNFGAGGTPKTGTLRSLRHSHQPHHESPQPNEERSNQLFSPEKLDHCSAITFEHSGFSEPICMPMQKNTHTLPKESKSSTSNGNGKKQARSKELQKSQQILSKGTVDDFHFSYFTCLNDKGIDGILKHQTRDSYQDNASQDSYHLQESQGSPDFDSKTPEGRNEIESGTCFVDAELHHFEPVLKPHYQCPDVIVHGKSLTELSFQSARTLGIFKDSRRDKFSKVRPATIAYEHIDPNGSNDFTVRKKVIQSYITDVDSLLSPLEEPSNNNIPVKNSEYCECQGQNDQTANPLFTTANDEECITIVDSKEDGIKYVLHRRHMHSKEKDLSDSSSRNQQLFYSSSYLRNRTDMEKVRNALSSMQGKSNEFFQGRIKAVDYVMYKKLPHRDSFSSRDDSIESSLFPKESHCIWKKVKDERSYFIDTSSRMPIRRKDLDMEETDFPVIELVRDRKSHRVVEYDADKVLSSGDGDELQRSIKIRDFCYWSDLDVPYFVLSCENIKQYCYRNSIKMLPYAELIKMESYSYCSDNAFRKRQCFRTMDKFKNFTKISSSYKTGFATGSSSSFSINDELELDIKIDPVIYHSGMVTSSKNGISSCDSHYEGYANIDKHEHVMEWLEEQQAIFEPLDHSFPDGINNNYFIGSHQPCSDLIRNSGNYSPCQPFSSTNKETSSLPGSVPSATEFFEVKKGTKQFQTQSSFGTQSFPEPILDVSSDDDGEVLPGEDFYDVNQILDYVVTSNNLTSRELLSHHDLSYEEFSEVDQLIDNNEIKTKIMIGREVKNKDDSLSFTSVNSVGPKARVWHRAERKVFLKSASVASTHEEEHISDILDALEGHDTGDLIELSDTDAESWDCILDDSGLLTESLKGLEQADLTKFMRFGEGLATLCHLQSRENPSQEPQLLELSLASAEVEVFNVCHDEIIERDSTQVMFKPKLVKQNKVSKCQKGLFQQSECKVLTKSASDLQLPKPCKKDATENVNQVMSITEIEPLLLPEKLSDTNVLFKNEEYVCIKKPVLAKTGVLLKVCDAMNEEMIMASVKELRMESEEKIEVAYMEACPRIKKGKPKLKPKRVPDKFELFLAGIKVNLENILARDPVCENIKEEIIYSQHQTRISWSESPFFNMCDDDDRLPFASCENVIQSKTSLKPIVKSRSISSINIGRPIGPKKAYLKGVSSQSLIELVHCDNVKGEIRRSRVAIRVFMI